MNTQVQVLENSQVSLTVEVEKDVVSKAIATAYNEMKKDFNIQGFRKGKVPRPVIERMYGVEVFFNKAADIIIDETLGNAIDENNIDIAARIQPGELNVVEMTTDMMKYEAKITVKPEVKLGEYKNLEVEVATAEVTDEEVDQEITREAEKNSREVVVEDRAVEPQDTVTIDFEGFIDGEAFEGGKGENHDLVIGSKSFIPGFEDQLIGKSIGEDVEVNVEFPEDYQAEHLAGKPALFKVAIKGIKVKELPEINDDFAADVSEFETLAEYKEDVKAKLVETKETNRKNEIENKAIEQAVANAEIEVPAAMIEEQVDKSVRDFSGRMKQQGLELEQYLQFTGMDMDAFRENFKKDAETQLRSRLVLEKIVEAENIEVTDADVDAEMEKIAEQYKMELDQVKTMLAGGQRDLLVEDLKVQKAAKVVTETVQVK